jgi:hypothetical protein
VVEVVCHAARVAACDLFSICQNPSA